ncbi:MAG TPA: prepilin-type N-terminal cleavage/methylation domain-containing protein [Thermodesulfobacteriota bacterium]
MRFKFKELGRSERGYTIIELLIVAAIIGILLAIAIPNLIKARISANEANARKAMQTLRDAEGEFFEQDADNNGTRDFTDLIGDTPPSLDGSLRCPDDGSGVAAAACAGNEQDALVDNSFTGAITTAGDGSAALTSDCPDSKAGYCVGWTGDSDDGIDAADWARVGSDPILQSDFGFESSPNSVQKSGRRDYGVWGDGVIRCTTSTQPSSNQGTFEASRDESSGGFSGACD